ncbi:FecR family protein [Butyricimonas paravirosa]|uniref:FecR family protein n=1 Tax=Butyricimonas paravirosa TaxID=1472417 RepID=UPI002109C494|nr:FecR domain-containing protein [Butyricimonas paravirosa]MCQ4874090.1 FecR domain-containing protein [Butyricimonas paravirosa]
MDDYKYKMIQLMHLYLSGAITDEEKQELQQWLDASLKNKALFDRVKNNRHFGSKYKAFKSINHDAAFERFEKRVGVKSHVRYSWLKYAAIFLLPLSLGVFLLLNTTKTKIEVPIMAKIVPGEAKATLVLADGQFVNLQKDSVWDITVSPGASATSSRQGIDYSKVNVKEKSVRYNTLKTPRGGEFNITLSDGSVVHLNSATELKYPVVFDEEKREVHVSGEAYFEVKKEEKRPFYVVVDGMRIRVYGTSFNVNTQREGFVQTVLVEGSVGIMAEGMDEECRMSPSQLAEYNKERSLIEVKEVDVESYVAWKDGFFVFEDESLEQIMNTLSLWYDVDVFYVNPQLKGLHFTGHMRRYDQIDNILKAIGSAVGVTFSVKDRSIWVSK